MTVSLAPARGTSLEMYQRGFARLWGISMRSLVEVHCATWMYMLEVSGLRRWRVQVAPDIAQEAPFDAPSDVDTSLSLIPYATLASTDFIPSKGGISVATIEIHLKSGAIHKFPSGITNADGASNTRERNAVLNRLRGLFADYMITEGEGDGAVRRPATGSKQVDYWDGVTEEGAYVIIPGSEIRTVLVWGLDSATS